jgi:hypothetical protein
MSWSDETLTDAQKPLGECDAMIEVTGCPFCEHVHVASSWQSML